MATKSTFIYKFSSIFHATIFVLKQWKKCKDFWEWQWNRKKKRNCNKLLVIRYHYINKMVVYIYEKESLSQIYVLAGEAAWAHTFTSLVFMFSSAVPSVASNIQIPSGSRTSWHVRSNISNTLACSICVGTSRDQVWHNRDHKSKYCM